MIKKILNENVSNTVDEMLSGSTSGIVNAPSREGRVKEMVDARLRAVYDREEKTA